MTQGAFAFYLSLCVVQNLLILFAGFQGSTIIQVAKALFLTHAIGYATSWIVLVMFFLFRNNGTEWSPILAFLFSPLSLPIIESIVILQFEDKVPEAPIFSSERGKYVYRVFLKGHFYIQLLLSLGVILISFYIALH